MPSQSPDHFAVEPFAVECNLTGPKLEPALYGIHNTSEVNREPVLQSMYISIAKVAEREENLWVKYQDH
jgi:hypothetical protein